MQRAFNLVEQLPDVVQVEPGPPPAEVTGLDPERLARPWVASNPPDHGEASALTTSRNARPVRRASDLSFAATSSSRVKVVRT